MATLDKIAKYKELLINLLPKGRLWRPKGQPKFSALLGSEAEELARVDDRVAQMRLEVDPTKTDETLDQWESVFGIPDECTPDGQSVPERRTQLIQKMTNVGGLSKTFYEFLCLQLGFIVSVDKTKNFLAGRGRAGDPLHNYFNRHFVAGSECGNQLSEIGWRYYFNAEMPITASVHFVAGSFAGDPLRLFANPLIECTIKKLKPANAGVTFTFKE
jgi:uncharacterized protein YmfQ (DUF2313 family)